MAAIAAQKEEDQKETWGQLLHDQATISIVITILK